MSRFWVAAILIAGLVAVLARPGRPQEARPVGVALVLLVDVSASIDDKRYELQRDGIASAFLDRQVMRSILSQPGSAIAVTLVMWSDSQQIMVPWSIIDSVDTAANFAAQVAVLQRPYAGTTGIGDAIKFGAALLVACPCQTDKRVLDVSGDGKNNNGIEPGPATLAAAANGIIVNGLPILGGEDGLTEYYRNEVVGESGGFIVEAKGFDDFGRAIRAKLMREVAAAD